MVDRDECHRSEHYPKSALRRLIGMGEFGFPWIHFVTIQVAHIEQGWGARRPKALGEHLGEKIRPFREVEMTLRHLPFTTLHTHSIVPSLVQEKLYRVRRIDAAQRGMSKTMESYHVDLDATEHMV